jgi:rubrerythrin
MSLARIGPRMSRKDPYDPEPPFVYECMDCGHRVEADHHPEACPKCDGEMQDISVTRE